MSTGSGEPIRVRVVEVGDETDTVRSIRFARSDGRPLGTYVAGAHVDVTTPTGITRQYSLYSTPDDPETYAVAVKRETSSRGGSVAMHQLAVGDELTISAPRNLLGVVEGATHHLLIAAGIGITPMLSMARWLHVHGRPFDLHYFARSAGEAAFLPLLQDRCPEALHVHLGLPRSEQDAVVRAAVAAAPSGSHAFVCGPEGFMDKVEAVACEALGPEHFHRESFQASESADQSGNRPIEVTFEGATYVVPADRTILQVLNQAGADIASSCSEGICGTCIMTVLAGVPEHRDNVLTKAERASGELMTVCVSRAQTPKLTLDYY